MKKAYVKVEYLDENKNWQCEEITIEKWAEITSKKPISSLYVLEEVLSKALGREIILSRDFPEMRKPILNFVGEVNRLPENLIIRDEINSPDEGGLLSDYNLEFGIKKE